jgi:cell division inhibitor SulA
MQVLTRQTGNELVVSTETGEAYEFYLRKHQEVKHGSFQGN